jgi:hypothetical protein
MASLVALRSNVSAIQDGDWVPVNPDDPFDIKVRGFTPRYRDKLNALRREAARKANRGLPPGQMLFSVDALPPTIDDLCQGQALASEVFLDVRGLTHTPGGPAVTADEFRDMLRNSAEFSAVLMLTLNAAMVVHASREDETAAAVGNSQPASAGS